MLDWGYAPQGPEQAKHFDRKTRALYGMLGLSAALCMLLLALFACMSMFCCYVVLTDPSAPTRCIRHQRPGGSVQFQSLSLGLAEQWDAVKEAYAAANRALGNIVKVTPSSKVVGDLATFMVSNFCSGLVTVCVHVAQLCACEPTYCRMPATVRLATAYSISNTILVAHLVAVQDAEDIGVVIDGIQSAAAARQYLTILDHVHHADDMAAFGQADSSGSPSRGLGLLPLGSHGRQADAGLSSIVVLSRENLASGWRGVTAWALTDKQTQGAAASILQRAVFDRDPRTRPAAPPVQVWLSDLACSQAMSS
jgi:Conserved carboxylase domain